MMISTSGDLPLSDARSDGHVSLAKVFCHNLCCLIQSHYELGIETTF
jgi:hypothetical protein